MRKLMTFGALCAMSMSAFAAGDIESFFTNEKKASIRNGDIPGAERGINSALGTENVTVDIDWKSFERIGYDGAQTLGANLQTVAGTIINGAQAEPELKASLAKKVKKVILRHDPKLEVPKFKMEGGTLVFVGNHDHMDWKRAGSMRALLKKAL